MSNVYNILITEDDQISQNMLGSLFESNEFRVYTASDGKTTEKYITDRIPDIIILDLGLPDTDGMALLRKIRRISEIPVVIVSARSDESDKVLALEAGADDYITKPFSSAELVARVRNAIRHSASLNNTENQFFSTGDLSVDFKRQRVTIHEKYIKLTRNEYSIVELLAKNAGKVLSYDYIIKSIWGIRLENDTRILRVNITNIRKKIENDTSVPEYIITETGIGYRMVII